MIDIEVSRDIINFYSTQTVLARFLTHDGLAAIGVLIEEIGKIKLNPDRRERDSMVRSTLEVPSNISFEQAIDFSNSLLDKMEAGEISPSEIAATVSELVKTENGGRGFFVTYLTTDKALADNPSPEVVQALRSHLEIVAELLAKNVAMSAATAIIHQRNGNQEMAKSAAIVRDRTSNIIKLIDRPAVYSCCREICQSASTGEGKYIAFLDRWHYDREQRQLICQALQQVLPDRED